MIKKRLFISLAVLLSLVTLFETKAAIGDWTLHTSYHNATYCQVAKNKIYVLSNGSLFSYNKEDNEIRTYDKINTLSDTNISFISYCSNINALVIIYKNTNIDLLYDDETVYNISDFKNSNITNKIINNICIIENNIYISTNFGIVELDLNKKEFNNTHTMNKNVLCCYNYDNYIYAGTDEGLYVGKVTSNLLDNRNWIKTEDCKVTNLQEFKGNLYYTIEDSGIYLIDSEKNKINIEQWENIISDKSDNVIDYNGKIFIQSEVILPTSNQIKKINYLYTDGNKLYAGTQNNLIIFENKENYKKYSIDTNSQFICADGNTLWNCKGYKGVIKCSIKDNKIIEEETDIIPDSPIRNYCEYMSFEGNELLVAGGNLNYFDITFYPGTVMTYDYKNGNWTNFPEEIINNTTGIKYRNVCCLAKDPNDPEHYYASSFGNGLYEFKNGEFVAHHNNNNSPIESVLPNSGSASYYVRVPRIKYDKEGNLWIVNTGCKEIIKILKSDGTWQNLYYSLIDKKPTMVELLFDSRGWLWMSSLQSPTGIFCAKQNNTPLDTKDDDTKAWYEHFKNQDGTTYEITELHALVEEGNGEIWIGTNTGLFVIKNPESFFNDGIFTQIKIPRNDGSGLADYLLNGTYIYSICVDGANRKWIGTKNSGIYLLSEDGLETIHHFTTENSPLPSNSIVSITINNETGEVFIGTDNGIVSFMSDATKPEDSLNESKVHAFPNPVKSDYNGDISIVGLTFNCNVKIVDAAGYLIYEGISTGGTFNWDGRNNRGDKVASGVYYVLAADEEGNEGVATKILIVK